MAKQIVFTSLRRFYSSSTYLTNVAISSKRRQSTEIVKPKINVRFAEREDMPVIYEMMKDLAEFSGPHKKCQFTLKELIEAGFGSQPWYYILVAERETEKKILGYTLFNKSFSYFYGHRCFSENTYVIKEERANKIGSVLLNALGKWCVENKCKVIDWQTLRTNHHALAVFRHIGARDLMETENRCTLRLDEPFLWKLAETKNKF